jgi:superfamily II DNA or RNA helicase
MPTPFETGSLLEVRGERWLLTAATPYGSCTLLSLEGRGLENARQHLSVIDPFDRSRRITTARPKRRPRRAVLRAALGAIVDARSATGLWTAADASMVLLAYQLEPALAAINGATRLLLADAVGLGKTIQAGLLLSELRERRWIEHALIVCPAGLRDTWARELRDRFGIDATVLDHAAIADRIAALPPGLNPWAGHAVAIASIDFVKRAEVMAALEQQPIDLLIADEAHHLAPGTDRGDAVCLLASRAPWCVLVSATPHSGDHAAFDYLRNIGSRGDAISIFRRSRGDVGLASARRPHVLPVTPTNAEAVLFAALDRYAGAIWRERGHDDHAVRLIAVTLSRRAASSARAIERTLARRLELLTAPDTEPTQPLLPWLDEDDGDHDEPAAMLSLPGLVNAREERRSLEELIRLARQCADGSKLRRLRRLLGRLHEPVVIFTEYRDSLEAIVDTLAPPLRVAAIHGGVPVEVRRSIVDAFNDGRVDVLVATDAAGEGLNLHHRCRLVVDVELPWNPLRLEQRIGRVDRLGQRRTVHAIRMFHAGSIEQRVLDHLRLRDRRAHDAMAPYHVTDQMIAGAIFDGAPITPATPPPIAGTRIVMASAEALRTEQQRSAHDRGAHAGSGLSWNAPRNGRATTLVLLTRRSFANEAGVFVHGDVDAHVVAAPPLRDRRECSQLIERLRDLLTRVPAPATAPAVIVDLDAGRSLIRRRICAIRAAASSRAEHQSSMFDHRAESAMALTQEALQRRDQALSRILLAIAGPAPGLTRVDVIAAWPEPGR